MAPFPQISRESISQQMAVVGELTINVHRISRNWQKICYTPETTEN